MLGRSREAGRLALRIAPAVLVLACGSSPRVTDPGQRFRGAHDIEVDGDYLQAASGAVFPRRLDGFERGLVRAYDAREHNVSAGYANDADVRITAYVYPARQSIDGRLRIAFERAALDLERHDQGLKRVAAHPIAPAGVPAGVMGFEGLWHDPARRGDERLQVFQCGRWFLKFRASYPVDDKKLTDAPLEQLQRMLSCKALATRSPAGAKPKVMVSSDVGDKNSIALWTIYGVAISAQFEMMPPEARIYGLPDHDFKTFAVALKTALRVHEQNIADSDERVPTFDELLLIQEAGMLEELIWLAHLGYLDPPAGQGLELDRFRVWQKENLPNFRYQVGVSIRLLATEQ